MNLIDIPVPVIAALNRPTTVHSEYALLADIVIATPDTVFQDKPHFAFGIVPGDSIHSLWPEVIGSIRGRTFVLTQQIIGAEEAKTLGVISEIVARDRLLHRAREIAGALPSSLRAGARHVGVRNPDHQLAHDYQTNAIAVFIRRVNGSVLVKETDGLLAQLIKPQCHDRFVADG